MRFLFSGGGTGGHVSPALAIADELLKLGHECAYVGNSGSIEEKLARSASLSFYPIRVQKLYRKLTPAHIKFPFLLMSSIKDSRKIIRYYKPDALICTGGFVSGPPAVAAVLEHIDMYIWDGNSFPGLTTRLLASRATAVFTAFDKTKGYLKKANCQNFWIPLRQTPQKASWNPSDNGLSGQGRILLITGGSQGSLAINRAVSAAVDEILAMDIEILWQTGKTGYKEFSALHQGKKGLYTFDFTDAMHAMMQRADLAVSRAGAMSIAELQGFHTPAVLVPLPTAAANHQYYNAIEQGKKGVAVLLDQKDLSPEKLIDCIKGILDNDTYHQEAFSKLPPNNSAADIVAYILHK